MAWTPIQTSNDGASNIGLQSYYRVVTASEPASYSWTTNINARITGGIIAYGNVDQVSPVNVSAQAITTNTAPSITTTVANTVLVACYRRAAAAPRSPPRAA